MVTLGMMVGRLRGIIIGKRAEIMDVVILIGIGCHILYEHIGQAN